MDKYGPPPPPYGVQPHVQVMPPPMMAAPVNYGPEAQNCMCPHCHANIRTEVRTESTTKTHIMALLLCVFLCWPCVCVPYCMDSCQNRNHYCPSCRAYLGNYSG